MIANIKIKDRILAFSVLIAFIFLSDCRQNNSESKPSESHPAYRFLEISSKRAINDDTCHSFGRVVVPLGLIDCGPGAFRNSRRSDAPPYEYKLDKTIQQGLFIIQNINTEKKYIAVSFGEESKGIITSTISVSACIWAK
jgi:hypothetical protein